MQYNFSLQYRMEFAKRIIDHRKQRGYSRAELCKIIGWTSPTTLIEYENCKRLPNCTNVLRIANALDIPVETLTDGIAEADLHRYFALPHGWIEDKLKTKDWSQFTKAEIAYEVGCKPDTIDVAICKLKKQGVIIQFLPGEASEKPLNRATRRTRPREEHFGVGCKQCKYYCSSTPCCEFILVEKRRKRPRDENGVCPERELGAKKRVEAIFEKDYWRRE